jgi:Ca-activated chloride channel family protein
MRRRTLVRTLVTLAVVVVVFGVCVVITIPKFASTRSGAIPQVAAYDATSGVIPLAVPEAEAAQLAPGDSAFNTEEYALIEENPFLSVEANPLSTFSIDVDRASYSNVRRFINEGRRPPRDAVRVEELVNYFPYEYPEPSGEHPFSITTEIAEAPWRPAHRLLRIGLKGLSVESADLPAANFVFLLDVSGSMDSPAKLPLLKSALGLLVNELRPEDHVAIVVYAGAAGLVLPSTPGDRKTEIHDALAGLSAGGSTAGGAGIQLAYDVARESHIPGGNNRVILATDGDFNVGLSSEAELVRLIEERRDQGTFLTVLGFGTGNLQDAKMEQLADHGNGNFAYIDDLLEARKVLVTEMGGTLLTIAKDVKIQVELNPARVVAYRLIGYENRLLRAEDFADDTKDAGELGAGHTVTALYEVIPVGAETDVTIRGLDSLRYRTPGALRPAAASDEIGVVRLRYKDPDGTESRLLEHVVLDTPDAASRDLQFAAAVAGFGMLLRDSEHSGSWTLADVVAAARAAVGEDEHGYRREFVRLVETVVRAELLAR